MVIRFRPYVHPPVRREPRVRPALVRAARSAKRRIWMALRDFYWHIGDTELAMKCATRAASMAERAP